MAGTISSTYIGKGNMGTRGYSPILYNAQTTREIMKKDESYTIYRSEYVSENEGRDYMMDNIRFEATKIPERKPQHFYSQQPHIIRFIPPMYNDVYKLDTNDIGIKSRHLPGDSDHLKNEQYLLRDDRLVDIAAPVPHKIHGEHTVEQHSRPDIINPTRLKLYTQNNITAQPNTPRFDQVNKTPVIMLKDTVDYTRRYIPQVLHGNPKPIVHQNTVNVETGIIDMRGRRINPAFNVV